MRIIGLTGGIGSGKSFVAKQFEKFGVAVYNSDDAAKRIEDFWPEAQDGLKRLFGDDIYINPQLLDRRRVASIVFADARMLQCLNELVHPLVKRDFDDFVQKNIDKDFVILESAILVQCGFYKFADICVLVTADTEVRIDRVIKRDGCTREQVLQRMNAQASDSQIQQFCQYTINNSGNSDLERQIKRILQD